MCGTGIATLCERVSPKPPPEYASTSCQCLESEEAFQGKLSVLHILHSSRLCVGTVAHRRIRV